MRKIKSINESKLDVRNEINYFIPADKREKYLKITANNKSISEETRNICNWLIDHNDEYIKMFGKKDGKWIISYVLTFKNDGKVMNTDGSVAGIINKDGSMYSGRTRDITLDQNSIG